MIKYQMYERELTKGGVYQHHTCVDKLDEYNIDLFDYEINITPKNETSPHDYIHISCLRKTIDDYVRKSVLDYFNISVDFPVVYFTRKVPFTPEFKCGFYLNTYKKFKSKYFKQTLNTIKLFKGLYNDIILAGDFDSDGNYIDESINIEVMPIQSKDVYFKIRNLLSQTFDIDNFDTCDNLFDDYSVDKFHFHVKIKYSVNGLVIKFYNTYPINPFLKYYDK
tara:strand:- start:1138 stop:1803 length:666 start_codon:yes stop_codon:yes gene_type:complete